MEHAHRAIQQSTVYGNHCREQITGTKAIHKPILIELRWEILNKYFHIQNSWKEEKTKKHEKLNPKALEKAQKSQHPAIPENFELESKDTYFLTCPCVYFPLR